MFAINIHSAIRREAATLGYLRVSFNDCAPGNICVSIRGFQDFLVSDSATSDLELQHILRDVRDAMGVPRKMLRSADDTEDAAPKPPAGTPAAVVPNGFDDLKNWKAS